MDSHVEDHNDAKEESGCLNHVLDMYSTVMYVYYREKKNERLR